MSIKISIDSVADSYCITVGKYKSAANYIKNVLNDPSTILEDITPSVLDRQPLDNNLKPLSLEDLKYEYIKNFIRKVTYLSSTKSHCLKNEGEIVFNLVNINLHKNIQAYQKINNYLPFLENREDEKIFKDAIEILKNRDIGAGDRIIEVEKNIDFKEGKVLEAFINYNIEHPEEVSSVVSTLYNTKI